MCLWLFFVHCFSSSVMKLKVYSLISSQVINQMSNSTFTPFLLLFLTKRGESLRIQILGRNLVFCCPVGKLMLCWLVFHVQRSYLRKYQICGWTDSSVVPSTAGLTEELHFVLSTHTRCATTCSYSISRDPMTHSGLHRHQFTAAYTNMHINKNTS